MTDVGSPLDANGDRWISRDGRSWLVTVEIAGPGQQLKEHLAAVAAAVASVQALAVAARTSGRAVVVSGVTVMLCALGLPITGVDQFKGLCVGIVLVVGLAVLGSVTVLPALVAALGPWVDRARVPWLGRRRTVARDSRFWSAVVGAVVRRPWLTGGLAALALVAVAWPASGMHLPGGCYRRGIGPRLIARVGHTSTARTTAPASSTGTRS